MCGENSVNKLLGVVFWVWAFLLLLSASTHSPKAIADGDLFLTTTVASYHFERPNDYCETNPGVGLRYFFNDNISMGGGTYKNSPCNQATYIMGAVETNKDQFFGVGFAGGIVSGYTTNDFPTAPIIGYPYLRIGSAKGRVHATILTIPHPRGLLGFALQWKIK